MSTKRGKRLPTRPYLAHTPVRPGTGYHQRSVQLRFFTLGDDAHERDLERGLLDHLRQFLLELGVGFALVGSQYRLTVGNEEFYIGLLFYHLKLRAYIVVDLKMQAFEPEFAGKMNFYLSAVNALRDINKPIGISEYRLVESLPEKLQGSLPTIEELESELGAATEEESQ
jgi:hypothetical protein